MSLNRCINNFEKEARHHRKLTTESSKMKRYRKQQSKSFKELVGVEEHNEEVRVFELFYSKFKFLKKVTAIFRM
jgi:hypothetical protein